MPIHHDAKLIFVHVPKTGGTSVEKAIKEYCGSNWSFWGQIHSLDVYRDFYPGREDITRKSPDRVDPKFREQVYHHLIYQDIERAIDVASLTGYLKFSVIRNPWDRLISLYEYGRQTGGRLATAGKDFREWFYDRPVSPQTWGYLVDSSGSIPRDMALIRFENFEDEFRRLMRSVGIDLPASIPHEKKVERLHYAEYYTKTMAEELGRECSRDVELFSYSF